MSEQPFSGLRILVVEDEYMLAKEVRIELEKEGAIVIGPAGSLNAALEFLESAERIDSAILDINLGGDSVFPIAAALADRKVPFVFASGYDASSIPAEFRSVPICDKPVEMRKLRRLFEAG